jgi:hypothetical protein
LIRSDAFMMFPLVRSNIRQGLAYAELAAI